MTAEEAFAQKLADVEVTAQGKVIEVLRDDSEGTPHQRFIISLPTNQTLLIINNLDFGYRVPVLVGDTVEVRGTYVWNELGGLIHHTHHDDRGVHVDGYIILAKEKGP